MGVLFLIILVILLFVVVLYLTLIVQVKVNITVGEIVIFIKCIFFKFHKNFIYRLNYFELIERYLARKKKRKKRNIEIYKSIFKAFFVKNINVYLESFEDEYSIVVKFNIVNVVTKKAILNE